MQSFTCRNEMGDEDILMCDPHKKPHNIIRCNDQPCPIWKVGDWSPVCDSMCERHRQVRCMNEKSKCLSVSLYSMMLMRKLLQWRRSMTDSVTNRIGRRTRLNVGWWSVPTPLIIYPVPTSPRVTK